MYTEHFMPKTDGIRRIRQAGRQTRNEGEKDSGKREETMKVEKMRLVEWITYVTISHSLIFTYELRQHNQHHESIVFHCNFNVEFLLNRNIQNMKSVI